MIGSSEEKVAMAKKAKKSDSSTAPASFTDTRRVKDLIALMAENGLSEIELVEDKAKIVLRRGSYSGAAAPVAHHAPVMHAAPAAAPASPAAAPAEDTSL